MVGMDSGRLALQVATLIAKGEAVPPRPPGEQYVSGTEHDRQQPGPFTEWRTQALAFLASALPAGHVYIEQFAQVTTPSGPNDPLQAELHAGVGVLRAVQEDIAQGYLAHVRQVVSGEIFTDFLDMAEHLSHQGYHHAAASIAGAVLEDALRRTLQSRGGKATGNLESMNQLAMDGGLYAPLVFKQVKVWIDLRNSADHGKWDEVEAERVASMIRDLPAFLSRDLGLAG
jgi:hypothetical protein